MQLLTFGLPTSQPASHQPGRQPASQEYSLSIGLHTKSSWMVETAALLLDARSNQHQAGADKSGV